MTSETPDALPTAPATPPADPATPPADDATPAPAPAAEPAEDATPPAEPAPPAWPHETLDFHGDTLEIRAPKRRAVAVLQMALTTSFDQREQNEAVARFMTRHMSAASLARVNERMSDPDDEAYADVEDYMAVIVAMIDRAADLAEERAAAETASAT